MHATWYVLDGGAVADPDDVALGADGVLRHKSGVAVAYGPHGPRSRGMSAAEIYAAREVATAPKNAMMEPLRNRDVGATAQAPRVKHPIRPVGIDRGNTRG